MRDAQTDMRRHGTLHRTSSAQRPSGAAVRLRCTVEGGRGCVVGQCVCRLSARQDSVHAWVGLSGSEWVRVDDATCCSTDAGKGKESGIWKDEGTECELGVWREARGVRWGSGSGTARRDETGHVADVSWSVKRGVGCGMGLLCVKCPAKTCSRCVLTCI